MTEVFNVKRIFAAVLALVLMMTAGAMAAGLDTSGPEFVDVSSIEDPAERAVASINYFHNILYGAEVDHVTYNEEDSSAEIYMIYNDVHEDMPSIDLDIAVKVSNTIALGIEYDCPEITAFTVHWHFETYRADATVSYTVDYDGYHYKSAEFPRFMQHQ